MRRQIGLQNLFRVQGLYQMYRPAGPKIITMYTRLSSLALFFGILAQGAVPNQYIVEMEGDPVAVHLARQAPRAGIRGAAANQRRAQIHEQQRPVRASLEAAQAQILDSLDTVANAFIVSIPDEKAAGLAGIPGGLRVHPESRL